jgi:hypothetical protein
VDGEEVVEMWKVKEWAVLLRVVWLKDSYWEGRKAKCLGSRVFGIQVQYERCFVSELLHHGRQQLETIIPMKSYINDIMPFSTTFRFFACSFINMAYM